MSLKQLVANNAVGRISKSARDTFTLLRAAWFTSENVGTVANDQLSEVLVTRLCRAGKTFLDVGAHIGSIISAVAHHDRSIEIIAFEAIPAKVISLHKRFPGVVVHGCAIGDHEGAASFFIDTERSGYSSLGKPPSSSVREISVPMKRLDDLVTGKAVDVVKIDVEGAELGVLRGATRIISESRPVIMFESAPGDQNRLGYTKEGIWEFLARLDYVTVVPNRVAHNDAGLSCEGFIESHLYPRRTTNYFAIPRERRIEIRDRARELLGIRVS
jgi:FkbM family methyltransferase